MDKKLTRALFRNVMEMSNVINANAFVILEYSSGERVWAGTGSFRDEFLDEGRLMNGDDQELSIDFVVDSAAEEDDDDNDNDNVPSGADGPDDSNQKDADAVSFKEKAKRKRKRKDPTTNNGTSAENEKVLPEKRPMNGDGGDDDDDDIIVLSPPKPKKTKTPPADPPIKEKSLQPKQPQKKETVASAPPVKTTPIKKASSIIFGDLQPADYHDVFRKMRFHPTKKWMGKDLMFWMHRMAFVREAALKRNREWHDAHPPLLTPEWHILSHVRHRLGINQPLLKTTEFGFWVSLRPRRVCPKCLCIGGSSAKRADGDWSVMKRHWESSCAHDCCGVRRCRFCAHAHGQDVKCGCTCWIDCLKIMKIIPGRVPFLPKYNPNGKSVGERGASPAKSIASTEVSDTDVLTEKEADVLTDKESDMETDRQAELSSANEATDDESSVWKWNGRDLNENLQIVSEVIIREAKPDHEPLHDLSAHLTLWMENAAAGRYTNFFSHVLVNGFCEGCCCFLEVQPEEESKGPVTNVHTIAECRRRCCGLFLCKLCLHKHELDDECDCDCVNSAIRALGLDLPDPEKVHESTKAKWEKIEFGRSFKKEVLEKQRQEEFDDW